MRSITILAMFAIVAGATMFATAGLTSFTMTAAQTTMDNATMGNMTGGNMTSDAMNVTGSISGERFI
jgi:hypothetical protein